MISACSGFFGDLGLRMVGNLYDAAYIIDAVGGAEGGSATVTITVRDKTTGEVLFNVSNVVRTEGSPSAAYLPALAGMKAKLHESLDKFIGRANADGRKVMVRLCNYDSEYKAVVDVVKTDPYREEYHQFMVDTFGESFETDSIREYFGFKGVLDQELADVETGVEGSDDEESDGPELDGEELDGRELDDEELNGQEADGGE